MPVQDISFNQLGSSSALMLGYVPPVSDEQRLDIYRFLIEEIRRSDQTEGRQFVQRFLKGKQEAWNALQDRIMNLPLLWDVSLIPDDFLVFLKNIVGWTRELDHITADLSNFDLRRLIANSVPLWKTRGPEDSILNVINLVTGTRLRIWNWFQLRWVLGETEFGEDHQGFDTYMISEPGTPPYHERRFNVRIVDNGILDRTLVINVLKLMRPVGERIEINWLLFLDLFRVKDDNFQWSTTGGTLGLLVENGVATLAESPEQQSIVSIDNAVDWSNYVAYWRVKGTGLIQAGFYLQDFLNGYWFKLDLVANTVTLYKRLAGVETPLATSSTLALSPPFLFTEGVYYGIRAHVSPELGTNRINLYLNGNLIFSITDSTFLSGTIGIRHGASGTIVCDEVEAFALPGDTDYIDINE